MEQEIDILIPCYESSKKLKNTIKSFIETTELPYNLILTTQKKSVPENRNHLIQYSRARWRVFADDDIEIRTRGWDKLFVDTLQTVRIGEGKKRVGMVGPRVVPLKGKDPNASYGVPKGERQETYVSGTFFMYDAWALGDLAFDAMFIKSQIEDWDFWRQTLEKGYAGVTDGRVEIVHHNEEKESTDTTRDMNRLYCDAKWQAYELTRNPEEFKQRYGKD